MDAVGTQLKGSEFVGQDLKEARFDKCDLSGVRFYQCDLSRASFRQASLTGATIDDCGLENTDFTDAGVNGLDSGSPPHGSSERRLSFSQLTSTRSYKTKDLSSCTIPGILSGSGNAYDFREADLQKAILIGGDFTQCDFTNAFLHETRFYHLEIAFDQLKSTKYFQRDGLRHMVFHGVVFKGTVDFSAISLEGSVISARIRDADYTDADISGTRLRACLNGDQLVKTKNFRHGDLAGIAFLRLNLSGVDFSRQNLTRAEFSERCDLTDAKFNDAVITGARFHDNTKGLTTAHFKSTWNFKHERMDGVMLPPKMAEALDASEQLASDTTLRGALAGRVMLNARPLTQGSITILRPSRTPARYETEIVDGQYDFTPDNIRPGRYRVFIESDRVSIPQRYNASSELSVEIQRGENSCNFELTLRSH